MSKWTLSLVAKKFSPLQLEATLPPTLTYQLLGKTAAVTGQMTERRQSLSSGSQPSVSREAGSLHSAGQACHPSGPVQHLTGETTRQPQVPGHSHPSTRVPPSAHAPSPKHTYSFRTIISSSRSPLSFTT